MEPSEQITKLFKDHPYIFTEYNGTMEDYITFFTQRYNCKFSYRLPCQVNIERFLGYYKNNIVQTFFNVINGAGFWSTVIQVSTQIHLTMTFILEGEKFSGAVQISLADPRDFIRILHETDQFIPKKENRVLGFAGLHN